MLKHARICAIAAVAAGALALTGCSMDGGKKDKGSDSENSTSAGTTGGGEETPSEDTGGDTGATGDLDGIWIALNGGKPVSLVVQGGGKIVALAEQGGVSCTGTAADDGGTKMLNLKCQGGGKREMGHVKSVNSTSMTVEWEGVGTDEFKKSDKGGMDLPTDMPTVPQG